MATNATDNEPGSAVAPVLRFIPAPRVRGPTLKTVDDCAVELARVYRAMKARTLATQDGTRLAYVIGEIRKTLETADLERRLESLESRMR